MPLLALAVGLLVGQSTWKPPYEVLPTPTDPAPYQARLGTATHTVFLEGDVLTLAYRSEKDGFPQFNPMGLQAARIGKSDIWVARAKYSEWQKAFLSYGFPDPDPKAKSPMGLGFWSGPQAPKMPTPTKERKGTVTSHKIMSKALGEEREFSVYVPPGGSKGLPVLYMADGICHDLADVLEPMIAAGQIKPLVIVGVLPGGYRGDRAAEYDSKLDFRAREYLKMVDAERYAKHLEFFAGEVREFVESKYETSKDRSARFVGGFSNGGAFALTAAVDRSDLFSVSVPVSVAAYDREAFKASLAGKTLPRFFFAAGELEVFMRGTVAADEILRGAGQSPTLNRYVAGHDYAMVRLAVITALSQVLAS